MLAVLSFVVSFTAGVAATCLFFQWLSASVEEKRYKRTWKLRRNVVKLKRHEVEEKVLRPTINGVQTLAFVDWYTHEVKTLIEIEE